MSLTSEDMTAICGLVDDLCGICLDESKGYLIESRLRDLVKRSGCESYADLARRARSSNDGLLQSEIIDAITTNETLFFRDSSPFEALRHKVLPELLDARSNGSSRARVRIWSAACSTGQEAYSIAMTVHDLIPNLSDYQISITGTDVSDAAVQQASRGRYSPHEMDRGLAPRELSRHFVANESGWQVKDDLRSLVTFKRLDLRKPFGQLGKFDIVFCRNVAIYFSDEERQNLFRRIREVMAEDGALIIGSSESLLDMDDIFRVENHCRATLYRAAIGEAAVGLRPAR